MYSVMILTGSLLLMTGSLHGQEHQRYWVFFSGKDARNETVNIDYYDIPVSKNYIDSVKALTDTITVRSRWLNAVSLPVTQDQIDEIRLYPFVERIQPVARMIRPDPVEDRNRTQDIQSAPFINDSYYGFSETQTKLHNIHRLHNAGITGNGVTIGFLDTGYRWQQHNALQNAHVIGERDFVAEHYTDDQLPANHYNHGTLVFSVVAGYDPGTFVGVAPDASFLLGATEDIRTETPIEEDFWVAGIEWMADIGVDIVSTSLGYSVFDHPYQSYTPGDMDGRTAVATLAAERAFEKGILVVASAGNSGHTDWRIITSPADGEHVIAVGAINEFEEIAQFSSRGPSADGRIKPDISALGINVAGTQPDSNGYRFASGTSLSAPLVSGVAGLVLSARPDFNVFELRNSIKMSSLREGLPDNTYGYGILDATAAIAHPILKDTPAGMPAITTLLFGEDDLIENSARIFIRTSNETDYTSYPLNLTDPISDTSSGLYEYHFDEDQRNKSLHFVISAEDRSGNVIRYPRIADREFYLSPVHELVQVIQRIVPERFTLHQNYPNPFNSRTAIRFELPQDSQVTISIYDILGRYITTVTDEFYLAGVHEVVWQPAAQASGVYFYRIEYGGNADIGRMIYLR